MKTTHLNFFHIIPMAPLFKMFGTLVILGEPKMSLVCDLSGKFIENVSVSV